MVGLKPGLGPAALALSLVAASPSPWAQALSAADAAVLAGSCMNCHGSRGVSPGAIPSIAGRAEDDLSRILLAFRAGEVSGATVMTRIMKGFDDAEIAALVRYYASLPAGRAP